MYNSGSSLNSDAYLQTNMQEFSVSESTTSSQAPNLSCSFSGSTSITYSLSSYNGSNSPSFMSIDSSTGVLSIVAPSVSSSNDYSFYIDSTVSGLSSPVQKVIKLTVKKCTANNCQKCSITDSSVCMSCNSGYNLNSGSCSLSESKVAKSETEESESAKLFSMSNQLVTGAIILISLGSSLTNLSSMASLWSAINQMQILDKSTQNKYYF